MVLENKAYTTASVDTTNIKKIALAPQRYNNAKIFKKILKKN